jgi:PAS domain S-box-containing protein
MTNFLDFKISSRRIILTLGIAAILYLVLTLNLSFLTLSGTVGAPVWVGTGMAIAMLAVWDKQAWPGLVLGVVLFNSHRHLILSEQSLLWMMMIVIQLLEFWLGINLLRRYSRCSPGFQSLRDVLVFIGVVATLPAGVSATLATITLTVLGELPREEILSLWKTWFTSNATGILVITPMILSWSDRRTAQRYLLRDRLELGVVSLLAVAIAYIAFFQDYPIEYSLLPLLGWIAFRFGWREVTTLVTVIAAIAIIGTARGVGTFARPSVAFSLVLLQSFISVVALTALVFCAVLQERQLAQQQLKQYNQELEKRVAERTASLRESQLNLSRQQTFLRNVIDTNPSLIDVRDVHNRFVLANRSLAEFYGTSVENLIGSITNSVDDNIRAIADPIQSSASQSNANLTSISHDPILADVRAYEQVLTNAQGEDRWFYCLEKPLIVKMSEHETARYLLSVATDISDRKVAEQALEQAREAADLANRAKSEFLANMSHELRTPLNGILGYAQILKRNTHSEEQHQGITIIHQCGSHLLTLINDILDLSKIEARKTELHPLEFHFPAFLTAVSEICQIKAAPKGLSWNYQVITPIPEAVYADEKRLRQVLINLLGNAVKYTEVGDVTFEVAVIEHLEQKVKLRFKIQDTGVGMSQEQLDRIFDPFEQVGTASKMAEGTGLGLAISQKIVRLMGSEIQVQSQVNQGSVFFFDLVLPLAQEWSVQSLTRYGHVVGYAGREKTILVVDDKPENCGVIQQLLEPLGFRVLLAADGNEGYDRTLEVQPDLILTDLVMPGDDGFHFIERLRQNAEFAEIPIIVSSASVFEEDRDRSLGFGGTAFLPKPVQAEELLDLLQQLLELDWQYAVTPSGKTSIQPRPSSEEHEDVVKDLTLPNSDVLEQLLDWAKRGNLNRIRRWSREVISEDREYREFAEILGDRAQRFQERAILSMLQGALRSPKV